MCSILRGITLHTAWNHTYLELVDVGGGAFRVATQQVGVQRRKRRVGAREEGSAIHAIWVVLALHATMAYVFTNTEK